MEVPSGKTLHTDKTLPQGDPSLSAWRLQSEVSGAHEMQHGRRVTANGDTGKEIPPDSMHTGNRV